MSITVEDLRKKLRRPAPWMIFLLATIVVGYAAFMRGAARDDAVASNDEAQKEVDRVTKNRANATDLEDNLREAREIVAAIEERMIRADELARNLQYLYRLAEEAGVAIAAVNQLPPPVTAPGARKPPPTAYSRVYFTVVVSGDFPKVAAFIRKLETGRHFFSYTSVSVDRTNESISATLQIALLGRS